MVELKLSETGTRKLTGNKVELKHWFVDPGKRLTGNMVELKTGMTDPSK